MPSIPHPVVEQIPSLRRYARGLTGGNAANADDLVQDTLERAYAKWHMFKVGLELRPWLFSIMHNVFVNQERLLKNSTSTIPLDETFDIEVASTQESHVHTREILTAVGRLPPDLREALVLVCVEDFSYGEAAQVLGIPVGTVMSRLSRAREQLRALTGHPPKFNSQREIRLVR
jgi:RNA polymerase sigma-70 factor (ECF subfamily)